MENFVFPDEIVLKIFSYLSLSELIQCSKVSRRFNTICKDKSLSYGSSMLIMKDLTVENQKCVYNFLTASPEFTKVVIDSVSWKEGNGTRLSEEMSKRKFVGPKKYCLEKKKKVLKALGASVRVRSAKMISYRKLEIELFYYLKTVSK